MHYKDGTEAKPGDLVKGTTYNTPKGSVHVGVLLGITPGTDSCNARVLIPRVSTCDPLPVFRPAGSRDATDPGSPPITAVHTPDGYFTRHREAAPCAFLAEEVLIGHKVDYTACNLLELVHRPA